MKKGRSRPFFIGVFMLPVGLADFMGGRYCAFPDPSTGIFRQEYAELAARDPKKTAPFEGRGSLTGRKSPPGAQAGRSGRNKDGTERLKMYFDRQARPDRRRMGQRGRA